MFYFPLSYVSVTHAGPVCVLQYTGQSFRVYPL